MTKQLIITDRTLYEPPHLTILTFETESVLQASTSTNSVTDSDLKLLLDDF